MGNTLLVLNRFFAVLPAFACRYRWLILTVTFLASMVMAWGTTRLSLDMSIESFIDPRDPAVQALNEFRSQFGSDDSVFLVYEANDGDVFSAGSLRAVQLLTDALRNPQLIDPAVLPRAVNGLRVDPSELDHIRRVQSLTTLRVQRVDGDTLRSERLIPDQLPEDAEALAAMRERAMAEDDFRLSFFSPDGRFGAILIQTNFGARPIEGFVPAVDREAVSLADSFGDAAFNNSGFDSAFDTGEAFDIGFDPDAHLEDIPFQAVDMFEYADFFTAVRAVYSLHEEHLTFYPVGNPPLMDFMVRVMQQVMVLALMMIAVFATLLWVLFRSFSAVIWPIVIVSLSLLWTLGLATWLGMSFTSMITLTGLLTLAVGIADSVHVLSAYFSERRSGSEHEQALTTAYDKTGLAILITTLTTMCGVLALTISDLIPIRVFGITAAMGVFFAFLFTVVLLPILLSYWHPGAVDSTRQPAGSVTVRSRLKQLWSGMPLWARLAAIVAPCVALLPVLGPIITAYIAVVVLVTAVVILWQDQILAACPVIVARSPGLVLGLFGTVFLVSLYGTSQVRIDSNVAELARAGTEPYVAYAMVDEHMAGAQNVSVMIDTRASDGILHPDMLQAIDRLQDLIMARYPDQVSRTWSLADIVKETNRVMNQDNPDYYRVPDDPTLISQLLYLFNSANPEERRSIVSDDYSRSHITINAYNAGSYQYQSFFRELNGDIESTFAPLNSVFPDLNIEVTGTIPLMMRTMDEMAQSQYRGFLLALAVISVIMILTLGSVQAGLVAMIPNLIPALLTFGLLGLLGMSLDMDTLLIAPVIIGIAVDDTIHFMTHYRVALLRTRSMEQALRSTVQRVGKAVMFTTMILGLGFAILSFSDYLGMAKIGFFGSLAIFVALLCDLFLLPAMIMIFKPRFGIKGLDSTFDFAQTRSSA